MPSTELTLTPLGMVLLVDDDEVVRTATLQSLELAGLQVAAFESAADALTKIAPNFNGVIVSDIRMPHIDGLQFFKRVQAIDTTIPFILITGHADVPTAVQALRDGAEDFLPKPFASSHLVASVQRALNRRRLEIDNMQLRALAENNAGASPMIGESAAIVRLRDALDQVAEADIDVLIEGETGTGKELAATLLHRSSTRRAKPFVMMNCSSLPMVDPQDETPGRADSFASQVGAAQGGTLFLDEIDRANPFQQSRLLRLVEEREVVRAGQRDRHMADLRIIAATRSDLIQCVAAGKFREDLFYALNVVRLRIPPLRERRSDIALLFAHFLDEAAAKMRRRPLPITESVRRRLIDHDWPGNVRELRSFAFQAAVGFEEQPVVVNEQSPSLPERVERFEAAAICAALEECGGSAGKAIEKLKIPRKTFYDKLRRHEIDISRYRSSNP